ncbi:hypothetical protein HanRHA438_Chr15g0719621 [Helianthus annuus]|nr:hypothetical protein HanRHA438_Chr15g0719621 [Helianthus annuus]
MQQIGQELANPSLDCLHFDLDFDEYCCFGLVCMKGAVLDSLKEEVVGSDQR